MNRVHFSQATCEWETPQDFFDRLNEEFRFTLDVCASKKNHKCDKYYTMEDDGLKQPWSGVVWCNPPYGREIRRWVEKAHGEKCTTVMLLPARVDTQWFHKYIYRNAEIRFVEGRIKFGGSKYNAPFPSMVVIFKEKA